VLHEKPLPVQLAGAVVVLVAVGFATRRRP
jgi:drug/metabolite transporter (DMT)-like permease